MPSLLGPVRSGSASAREPAASSFGLRLAESGLPTSNCLLTPVAQPQLQLQLHVDARARRPVGSPGLPPSPPPPQPPVAMASALLPTASSRGDPLAAHRGNGTDRQPEDGGTEQRHGPISPELEDPRAGVMATNQPYSRAEQRGSTPTLGQAPPPAPMQPPDHGEHARRFVTSRCNMCSRRVCATVECNAMTEFACARDRV